MRTGLCRNVALIAAIFPFFIIKPSPGQPSSDSGLRDAHVVALAEARSRAEEGDIKAQNALGTMYLEGKGVPQSYSEAVRWFRKAADRGYAKGQYNLGNMYYYGRGVPQDRAEAEQWYHKAADQGDAYAQRALRLKGTGLGILGIVTRAVMFLWCLWVLKDALWPLRNLRLQRRPALAIAAVLGMTWVALSLYQAYGTFYSLLTVTAFYFVEGLVGGATMGILIAVFGPKSIKITLAISCVLLAANDLIVISRHQLMRFIATIPHFGSINGLLMGVVVPLGIVLWLQAGKTAEDERLAR